MLDRFGPRRSVKDFLEGVEDSDAIGKNAISQQERVEEIDGQESEIGQAFQQPLGGGVAYLRHLIGEDNRKTTTTV